MYLHADLPLLHGFNWGDLGVNQLVFGLFHVLALPTFLTCPPKIGRRLDWAEGTGITTFCLFRVLGPPLFYQCTTVVPVSTIWVLISSPRCRNSTHHFCLSNPIFISVGYWFRFCERREIGKDHMVILI